MASSLVHRGPDDTGYFWDADVPLCFGFQRLAIRDLAGGRQPMKIRDGQLVIVHNGEIYNSDALRRELESKGHSFETSHSDTEVLLHAYREWGANCVTRLNGMWAFAIFDKPGRKLFLSRDRFGEKPLFYTLQNGVFAFASELKALREHKHLALTVAPRSLQKYHAYGYFPGDLTVYQEVKKLPGGCTLILDLNDFGMHVGRYWSYRIEPVYGRPEEEWVEEIRRLLRQAVERQLVSDVPVGLFVSGGLDSAAVAHYATADRSGEKPLSFSVRFLNPSFDETAEALAVAEWVGTRHDVITFAPELIPSLQDRLFASLDEPLSDSSLMSYYLLCQHARSGVKVVLGGDAGDELFAGYDTFRALRLSRVIGSVLPGPCHSAILMLLGRLPLSHDYMPFRFRLERMLSAHGLPAGLWNPVWLGPMRAEEIAAVVGEPVCLEELYSEAIDLWDTGVGKNPVDRSLEFYGNLFLQDQILVKVDRSSMMHGLEVRTPLLDIDFVDCVRRIPADLKLKGNTTKYIFKKAMSGLLPDHIVDKKKMGLSAPLSRWFADGSVAFTPSRYWTDRARDLITTKLASHRRMRDDNRLFLWNSYVADVVLRRSIVSPRW